MNNARKNNNKLLKCIVLICIFETPSKNQQHVCMYINAHKINQKVLQETKIEHTLIKRFQAKVTL